MILHFPAFPQHIVALVTPRNNTSTEVQLTILGLKNGDHDWTRNGANRLGKGWRGAGEGGVLPVPRARFLDSRFLPPDDNSLSVNSPYGHIQTITKYPYR